MKLLIIKEKCTYSKEDVSVPPTHGHCTGLQVGPRTDELRLRKASH